MGIYATLAADTAVLVQGMEPDIDMLAGEALMVTGGADMTVMHFPVSAMPLPAGYALCHAVCPAAQVAVGAPEAPT